MHAADYNWKICMPLTHATRAQVAATNNDAYASLYRHDSTAEQATIKKTGLRHVLIPESVYMHILCTA